MRPVVEMPTPEEDAAIQRGIAIDPDTFELTDQQFAAMRPAAEMLSPLLEQSFEHDTAGMVAVALRVDADVAEALLDRGAGWQVQVNALLRAALALGTAGIGSNTSPVPLTPPPPAGSAAP